MSDFAQALYTVPEAAALLRVHENTIYNMIRKQTINHYRVGSQIRIARDELERLKVPAKSN